MSGARYLRSIEICPAQERCDGATLRRGRTICVACENYRTRDRRPKPLRGAHVAPAESTENAT